MKLASIYIRRDNGQVVDPALVQVANRHAQDNGYSPFADWVCVGPDGAPTAPWNDGVSWVEVREVLPPVGSDGDTCQIVVYGGSGCYQAWYEVVGGVWVCQGDTIPWQMKVG